MVDYNDYLAALAGPESGRDPTARNRYSGAQGLYQIMPATQEGLRRQGFALDMSTPEGQTRAASELTRQNQLLLRSRLRRDPTESELYFAHGFGGPAASYLLTHTDQPLGAALRTFYGGTRQGEQFADRIRAQNPNLAALWDRPVTDTVTDFGTRLAGGRSAGRSGPSPAASAGTPAPRLPADVVQPLNVSAASDPGASDFDPLVSAMPLLQTSGGEQLAQVPSGAPEGVDTTASPLPGFPTLRESMDPGGAYRGAQPAQPMPPPPRQPFAFSAQGMQPPGGPPAPGREQGGRPRTAPRSLDEARIRMREQEAQGEQRTGLQQAIEAGRGVVEAGRGLIENPPQLPDPATLPRLPAPPGGTVTGNLPELSIPDWLRPYIPPGSSSETIRRIIDEVSGRATGRRIDAALGTQDTWAGRILGIPGRIGRAIDEQLRGLDQRFGTTWGDAPAAMPPAATPPPAAPPPAATPPAAPPAPAPAPGPTLPAMPDIAAIGRDAGGAGGGPGTGAGAGQPDYARVMALMEQLANPQRPPAQDPSARRWDIILAALGAGGAGYQRGDTVGQVLGRAGAGAAAASTQRGQEERQLAERYELARQQALGQAAQVGTSVIGQQQHAALTREQLAQQARQHAQTTALQQYQVQLQTRVAEARLAAEERRARGGGGYLGPEARQGIIESLTVPFYPHADATILQQDFHGNESQMRQYLQTAEGRRRRQAAAWAAMMQDPNGRANYERYRSQLQAHSGEVPTVQGIE